MTFRLALAWVAATCAIAACCAPRLAAEEPRGNFEVHDLSLWILEQGSAQANMRNSYPTALPVTVHTARMAQRNVPAGHVGPINLIRFYGPPAANLDVDLRTKAGSFLAHWPASEGLPNRLRWSGTPSVDLVEKVDDESSLSYVDGEHWFRKAREGDALFIRRGARAERFLAYDVELNLPAPIKLDGGPDKYTVTNTSGAMLYDVLVSRSTPQGRRVAWLDRLPPSVAAKPAEADKPKEPAKLFEEDKPAQPPAAPQDAGGVKAGEKPAEATKKPADDDDAKANKEKKPGVSPKLFGGIAAKAKTDTQPAAAKPAGLFGSTVKPKPADKKSDAAKKPDDAKKPTDKKQAAPALVGVEMALGEPVAADSPQAAAMANQLAERLTKAGLRPQEVELFVESYRALFFESDAVVIACRLDPATIDEKIPLSIFPEPKKTVRVAMVVIRNADPQLGNEVDRLIAELGDARFTAREAAQKRLMELGPLAYSALNKALNGTDLEIVIRAERILLNQNQTPNAAGAACRARPVNGVVVPAPVRRVN